MDAKSVLIVEDEPRVRDDIRTVLAAHGMRVLTSDTVAVARQLFSKERPDLVLVDIGLPDGDGVELCRHIREHKERGSTPVIFLTGQGEFEAKATAFEAGADQYLVKPVAPHEVLLWVQALLRRIDVDTGAGGAALRVGELEVDAAAYAVRWQGVPIRLTVKEFELLYFLVRRRPQIVTRKQILSQVWQTIVVDQVVDQHLYNLRRKLPPAVADKLQAVPGKGFRFFE